MAVNTILALGSPIKDHLAPSMLGSAVNNVATVGGLSVAGRANTTATLTGGSTVAGTHTATQMTGMGLAKTATLGSVFASLFYTAAVVAAGYLGYRIAKGMWELISKKITKA